MFDEISQKQLESMIKKLPSNMKIKYKKEKCQYVMYESYWLGESELFLIETKGKQVKAYVTDYFRMIIQRQ